jgi:hypothetical protein
LSVIARQLTVHNEPAHVMRIARALARYDFNRQIMQQENTPESVRIRSENRHPRRETYIEGACTACTSHHKEQLVLA